MSKLQLHPLQWMLGGPDCMPPRGVPIVVGVFGGLEPATYSAFSSDYYERFEKYISSVTSAWTWAVIHHPNDKIEFPTSGEAA